MPRPSDRDSRMVAPQRGALPFSRSILGFGRPAGRPAPQATFFGRYAAGCRGIRLPRPSDSDSRMVAPQRGAFPFSRLYLGFGRPAGRPAPQATFFDRYAAGCRQIRLPRPSDRDSRMVAPLKGRTPFLAFYPGVWPPCGSARTPGCILRPLRGRPLWRSPCDFLPRACYRARARSADARRPGGRAPKGAHSLSRVPSWGLAALRVGPHPRLRSSTATRPACAPGCHPRLLRGPRACHATCGPGATQFFRAPGGCAGSILSSALHTGSNVWSAQRTRTVRRGRQTPPFPCHSAA